MTDANPQLVEWLTATWQRLLNKPAIGIGDNFFALGGTPASATTLFREIAQQYGRVFPPAAIYDAPTIESLAALVAKQEDYVCPPLLLIKPGTDYPPLFVAPGMGGDASQLFQVVQSMGVKNPLYGLQPRGTDGNSEPLSSIDEMAAVYLGAIRDLQPNGPYFFIGYSLGGLLSLEIAQRLLKEEQKVGLLVMVDTYPHKRFLLFWQRLRLLSKLAVRRVLPSENRPGNNKDEDVTSARCIDASGALDRRIWDAEQRALRRYRPQFYDDKIVFVQGGIESNFPDDAQTVWGHLARELQIEIVPADHVQILNTHPGLVASILSRHLIKALRSSERSEARPAS